MLGRRLPLRRGGGEPPMGEDGIRHQDRPVRMGRTLTIAVAIQLCPADRPCPVFVEGWMPSLSHRAA